MDAIELLQAGAVPSDDLYQAVLLDRDLLLGQIAARDRRIGELERELARALQMVACLEREAMR